MRSNLFYLWCILFIYFVSCATPKSRQPRKKQVWDFASESEAWTGSHHGPSAQCNATQLLPRRSWFAPKDQQKKKWFGFVDALINFLLFNYKLYLNTKRTKQTTEPLEKNTQRKNTSTRRNSWSSASQNNSWHAELAVTEKQKVKHTKPSIKKKIDRTHNNVFIQHPRWISESIWPSKIR